MLTNTRSVLVLGRYQCDEQVYFAVEARNSPTKATRMLPLRTPIFVTVGINIDFYSELW